MKKVVIIGAGTGGTIMAQQLNKELDSKNWSITIIDERTLLSAGIFVFAF